MVSALQYQKEYQTGIVWRVSRIMNIEVNLKNRITAIDIIAIPLVT